MKQEFVTLPREVVEQALKAMSLCRQHMYDHASNTQDCAFDLLCDAVNALRTALEQPQGEQPPAKTFDEVWDAIDWGKWRMAPIRELVREPLTDAQEEVAFEEFWYEHTMETFPKDYDMSRFSRWGEKYKPYARKAWFARAAISKSNNIK